jgi:hypothetical protein
MTQALNAKFGGSPFGPAGMNLKRDIESPGEIRIKNVNFYFVFVRSHSFYIVRK